ncbi:MAG: ABC transporter permease [Microthrixaceae bacterium]
MTPRTAIASACLPLGLAGTVGALLAAAGSVVASQWFPLGSARQVEPTPGMAVNWLYLVAGAVMTTGFTVLVAAVSSTSTMRGRGAAGAPRRSVIVTRLSDWGLPVPLVTGARFALERGRGANALPVRPALVGAVVGVLGVGSVLVFSHGIHHAVDDPELWGQTYQLFAFTGQGGNDFVPPEAVNRPISALKGITGVDDGRVAAASLRGGGASAELWSYQAGRKALPVTLLSGRMPESRTEVALAPDTMKAFTTSVGKSITVTADKGEATLDVVGEAFVPHGPHNDFSSGGWVTDDGYDALFNSFKFRIQFYSVDPTLLGTGAHAASAVNAALTKSNPELAKGGPVVGTPESQHLGYRDKAAQLERVGGLPTALAAFLALLAIGTVGHSLATAVHRRRKDIAVLRAIGMTRWQTRGIVVAHATTLVAVGVIFGIPLGLAIGRWSWRVVANYTPVLYDPPTDLLSLSLIMPAALVVAYFVASWPTIRASRLQVAAVLRAE